MFQKMMRLWAGHQRVVALAALAVAVIYPVFFTKVYMMNIGIQCLLYSLLALSLNFITGYTGIVVLGQAAFYGIGAYTAAILATRLGWTFIPTAVAGMVMAFIMGIVIGLPTLRIRGNYLSIVTLGFCEIVRIVELNWVSLTGGPFGIKNIPAPSILGFQLKKPMQKYYLILVLLILCILLVRNLMNSRAGRAWQAIKGDETAAQAMGVDVFRCKVLAFAIAASIAGLAGAFYCSYVNYIDSTSFSYNQSILILSMIIMGGLGSIPGSIIGGVFFITLPEILRNLGNLLGGNWGSVFMEYRQVVYGIVLVLMIMYRPDGILGGFNLNQIRLFNQVHGKKEPGTDTGKEPEQ